MPGGLHLRQAKRALVIGGSMSGLLAALALTRSGWDVAVYERVGEALAGRGAGIVAQPELKAVLRTLGLNADSDLGIEVGRRVMYARDGQKTHTLDMPQTMTAWDRVFHLLKAALREANYHGAKELRRVEQDAHGVTAHFADGSSEQGDLLIGADGIRSTVRQQYLAERVPLYAGYTAWRGLVAEADFPTDLHRDFYLDFAFCIPPNEQMLGYPVAGPDNDLRPGRRRYNFVWYRPASESQELPRLLTDDSGRTHALSIPPPLISRDTIARMRADAARLLAPQFNAMLSLCAQPFLQPIYDLEVPHMTFGRVAIIGDAAFVARPHVGAGVAKAADDAIALVQALGEGDDIAVALARFDATRVPAGKRIIARARHLGAYVQADLKTEEERRYAAQHQEPEAVLTETARLDF
jgi:2-polyprenyl-6-methoxyphenol hydroxylase-like FAD-dependent oxidoreductase